MSSKLGFLVQQDGTHRYDPPHVMQQKFRAEARALVTQEGIGLVTSSASKEDLGGAEELELFD